ncbi:prolyl 4-hydroxylase subunit alpha-1-like [Episyrphus balteatus]|uniref:prolyl 4-hydroxylase subunit alpha-1-like n=1 Tax=Episyrphus balteatus TaxID=286459 RepID=UPI0024853B00|nr:prolyl 4-hydroxylase subunit alpha-1-like [Episyrphus balteatus]
MSLTFHLLVVFLITIIIGITKSQTSITEDWPNSSQIADLLHTEGVIIENLRNYINALDSKITNIKAKTQEIQGIYDVAQNDTGKYFGNPINTFHLIKRMSHDWETLRTLASQDVTGHIVENITRLSEILAFPSAEDLDEVLERLVRAEDVHQLVSSQQQQMMVDDGEFNGIKLRTQMTWNDCLVLGKRSFKMKEYHLARTWLETALKKLTGDTDNNKANVKILEMMAKVEYKSGTLDLEKKQKIRKVHVFLITDNYNFKNSQSVTHLSEEGSMGKL